MSKDTSHKSVGAVVFRKIGGGDNQLYLSIEDRYGKISGFYPIESEVSYQRFVSATDEDCFLCELSNDVEFGTTSFQALVFYEGNTATFLDKRINLTDGKPEVGFLRKLAAGNSFSEYSLSSYLNASLSEKINGINRTSFSNNKKWTDAEISFFQRSGRYWDIVERSGFSIKPSNTGLASRFRSRRDMLEWLMKNPRHYFKGDDEQKLWVSAWLRLSDISSQDDVLDTLGIDFSASQSIYEPDLLRVLRRLRIDWRSYGAEGIAENLIDKMLTQELTPEHTSVDLNIALDIHALVTRNLFKIVAKKELSAEQIDRLMRWFDDNSDRPKSMRGNKERVEHHQGNRSLSCDWLVASATFGARLGKVNPSLVPRLALLCETAIGMGVDDLGHDEFETAAYALSTELMPMLKLVKKNWHQKMAWSRLI